MADVFITDIAQTSEINDSMELVGDNGTKTYSFTAPTLKKYITKDFVRPNLLYNWYFLNPVNQRGLLEYTDSGNNLDGWSSSNNIKVSVLDEGIKLENTSSTSSAYYRQYFENPLPKGTYTISVFADEVNGRVSMYLANSSGTNISGTVVLENGIVELTANVLENEAYRLAFTVSTGASAKVKGIKVECGTGQTLGHQNASGEWMFNEIPDYDEQLRKCQRYFVRFANFGSYLRSLGTGLATNTAGTNARFSIPVPVAMRTKPSISVSNYSSVYCYRAGARTSITELKVIDTQGDMGNVIVVDATTTGLTAQEICNLVVASCTIEISAEIAS